jgi:hypothetical protein
MRLPLDRSTDFMRSLSSPVRTFVTAGSLALLWLLSVLPATAAPGGRYAGPVCDPQTTTLRKLARQPKSFGGPLKQARTPHLFGLTDPSARLQRGTHTTFDGDDAAIQNDAPAARIADGGRALPSLRPIGVLVRPVDSSLRSPAFCPRAPRGPPLAA